MNKQTDKRRKRAKQLAVNAFTRSGISEYHVLRTHFIGALTDAIERMLKREDYLDGLIRWYESECQRLKSSAIAANSQ